MNKSLRESLVKIVCETFSIPPATSQADQMAHERIFNPMMDKIEQEFDSTLKALLGEKEDWDDYEYGSHAEGWNDHIDEILKKWSEMK